MIWTIEFQIWALLERTLNCYQINFVDFHCSYLDLKLESANQQDKEAEQKLKVFQPVNNNLIILDEYTESLGEGYWNSWAHIS